MFILYESRSIVSNQFDFGKPINIAPRPDDDDDDGHNGRTDGERKYIHKDKLLSKP